MGPGALNHPGYVDSEIYYQPGDLVALPPLGFSALGWMVAHTKEGGPDEAARILDEMMQHLDIALRTPDHGV